jgi:hypothetical protein
VVVPVEEQAFKKESVAEQFTQDTKTFKSVKPVPVKGQVVAKKKVVKEFFNGWAKRLDKIHDKRLKKPGVIIKKPKTVLIDASFNRKGYVTLSFDQEMLIPNFGKKERSLADSKKTIGLHNIDVSRDILNLDFILKSDINPKDIIYSLELKEWSTKKIGIQIDFKDPL